MQPQDENRQPNLEGEEAPPFPESALQETPRSKSDEAALLKPKRKNQDEPGGERRKRSAIVGIGAGIICGLIARLLFGSSGLGSLFDEMSFAFLIVMPVSLGALTVYLTPSPLRRSFGRNWGSAFATITFFMLATMVLALEVFICILMASPLLYFGGWVGSTFMTWFLRQWDGGKSKHYALLVLLAAPYFIAPVENMVQAQDSIRTVESRIIVRASLDTVWKQVTRVAPISQDEYGFAWSNLFGIPRPVEATLSVDGIGGVRDASFADGLRFMEEVFEWNPPYSFNFTIKIDPTARLNPPFGAIGGKYFNVIDAQYVLEPQADGTVLVRLISRERVTTRFNGYATIWTDFLMNDLQDGILRVIRTRAEKVQASQK